MLWTPISICEKIHFHNRIDYQKLQLFSDKNVRKSETVCYLEFTTTVFLSMLYLYKKTRIHDLLGKELVIVMTYENICEVVDTMCMERDTELAYYMEHLQSLKKVVDNVYATPQNTKNSVQKIKDFAELRGAYVTEYLEDFFGVDLRE